MSINRQVRLQLIVSLFNNSKSACEPHCAHCKKMHASQALQSHAVDESWHVGTLSMVKVALDSFTLTQHLHACRAMPLKETQEAVYR